MLIRSQDKKSLVNLDNATRLTVVKICGKNEKGCIIEVDKIPFTENLGKYSTEAKAIKVLDMIQDAYTPTSKAIQLYIDGILPKIALTNTVFKMPEDKEVE